MNKKNVASKLIKGAVIAAGVAAAGVVLSDRKNRQKLTKGVRKVMDQVEDKMHNAAEDAHKKYQKTVESSAARESKVSSS